MLFSRGIDDGHTFFRIGFCDLAMKLGLTDWFAAVIHPRHANEHVGSNQLRGKPIIEFVRHIREFAFPGEVPYRQTHAQKGATAKIVLRPLSCAP